MTSFIEAHSRTIRVRGSNLYFFNELVIDRLTVFLPAATWHGLANELQIAVLHASLDDTEAIIYYCRLEQLRSVSRHWDLLIRSEPNFWTLLHPGQKSAMVARCLQRSGSCGMALYLTTPRLSRKWTHDHIVPRLQRIQRLRMGAPFLALFDGTQANSNLLHAFSFPNLEHLEILSKRPGHSLPPHIQSVVDRHLAQLRTLSFDNVVPSVNITSLCMEHLTITKSHCTFVDLMEVLVRCPNLLTLEYEQVFQAHQTTEDPAGLSSLSYHRFRPGTIPLHRLQSLYLTLHTTKWREGHQFIECCNLPEGTDMTIRVEDESKTWLFGTAVDLFLLLAQERLQSGSPVFVQFVGSAFLIECSSIRVRVGSNSESDVEGENGGHLLALMEDWEMQYVGRLLAGWGPRRSGDDEVTSLHVGRSHFRMESSRFKLRVDRTIGAYHGTELRGQGMSRSLWNAIGRLAFRLVRSQKTTVCMAYSSDRMCLGLQQCFTRATELTILPECREHVFRCLSKTMKVCGPNEAWHLKRMFSNLRELILARRLGSKELGELVKALRSRADPVVPQPFLLTLRLADGMSGDLSRKYWRKLRPYVLEIQEG